MKIFVTFYLVSKDKRLCFQSLLSQDTEKDDFLERDGWGRARCSADFR